MWYRIYFIGKFKIMLIVNEIISTLPGADPGFGIRGGGRE